MGQLKDSGKEKMIKVLIPPKLTPADKNFNPAYDIPQYEWQTVGQYKDKRTKDWLENHKNASSLVVNQEGTPLYALYTSPFGSQEESTHAVFRMLRANKYNEREQS